MGLKLVLFIPGKVREKKRERRGVILITTTYIHIYISFSSNISGH